MKPFKSILLAAAGAVAVFGATAPAHSQAEPYLGQITSFAFGFCPKGWAEASGQVLSVSANSALFALYGVRYGGDGHTNFALPNLNGRHAAGSGLGPGLSPLQQGAVGGHESVTLTQAQMPAHTHSFHASSQSPDSTTPDGGGFATYPPASVAYAAAGTSDVAMNPAVIQPAGGNQPIGVQQPSLALTWCVATTGIFPPRP
ncbi:MAG: tail fiber protein [Oceanicaulis sp.]|nr:tail fiber protein [Oceanicaulis sp.]